MEDNEKKILKDEQTEQSARRVSDDDLAGVVGGQGYTEPEYEILEANTR